MKSILLVFIILFPVSVFAEKLRVLYNYQSNDSYTRSGTDFLFGYEINALGEITISSSDLAIVKSKTIIPEAPYQLSYHVELSDSGKLDSVKMYDKKNKFEMFSPSVVVLWNDPSPREGLTGLDFWVGPQYTKVRLDTHFFCNAPNIVNAVNSAISSYLGNNFYKILISLDAKLDNHCGANTADDRYYICTNTFVVEYLIETVDDGNLTCENCKKPDALDKMADNVLKITDKLKKQEESKITPPTTLPLDKPKVALIPGKTEDVKKEAQKIYTLGSIGPGGGKVFFVDGSGMHGLETTAADEPNAEGWAASAAAARARGPGWRLPTVEELKLLWQNREAVKGSLYNQLYWSSTEEGNRAYTIGFPYQSFLKDRAENKLTKAGRRTRPVREF
jgi:hypothetical protein